MANADAAYGFKPVNVDGSPYSGATVRCVLVTGNGTATFIGDPIQLAGGTSVDGAPEVVRGVKNTAVLGVVTSFEPDPATSLEDQYRKASTQRFCAVALADKGWFMVQDDSDSGVTALGVASAGLNADFTMGSGNTTTGLSTAEIDASTELTTNTLDLQLWAPVNRPDNDATLIHADWIVKFNNSQTANARTGT